MTPEAPEGIIARSGARAAQGYASGEVILNAA
jgi:hypothetical protein